MDHATPDNGENNIHNILLINYVGNRSYSLASQSRGGDSKCISKILLGSKSYDL